ncbi:alpha/beta hydrolase family protein [Pedobacter sp. MW01-1-1]|uniref:alpha/beta hydrolase family protein n=1 Tax=Pedobacter sp. MW01-1-1 TaxID=3383027 RepID=UPI003FF04228
MRRIGFLMALLSLVVKASFAQNFQSSEVTFSAPDGKITYGGTLSIPEGNKKYPAIVLVSGTGKQDRDGTMAGHKLFLDIANELTKNGYAVLRVDDRGVGKTTGIYETSTTEDFANDALLALQYLKGVKQIDSRKIGLLGHSEGGAAMSIAAAKSKDVAFLISLAGLAMNGYESLIAQNESLVAASALPDYDKARSNDINKRMFKTAYIYADSANMEAKLNEAYAAWKVKDDAYFKTLNIEFDHFRFPIYSYVRNAIGPWYRYLVKYNAEKTMAKIKVPVLAINGDKDLMVPGEANLRNWKNYIATGGNKNVETHLMPNLNHLLLPCVTCKNDEVASIKSGISPDVLKIVVTWLNKTVK